MLYYNVLSQVRRLGHSPTIRHWKAWYVQNHQYRTKYIGLGRGKKDVFQTCTIVTSSIAVLQNAVVLILFGADTIDLMELWCYLMTWVTPDLYCIYVFIKSFIMKFLCDERFFYYWGSEALPVDFIWTGGTLLNEMQWLMPLASERLIIFVRLRRMGWIVTLNWLE